MDEQTKIQILLKEYDALRAEILQRSNQRFAFLTLFGAIGTYSLFIASSLKSYQIIALIFSAVFLLAVWFRLGILIARCSRRISEIEEEINSMAGQKLLKWESEKIGSKVFHKFHK